MNNLNKVVCEPKQARAKETYNKLLEASQFILEHQGIEALNSNAIAKQAGLTPPAFYRYFDDKYAVLSVLCERLLREQNAVKLPAEANPHIKYSTVVNHIHTVMTHVLTVTREFEGGLALLQAMRALPELNSVRLLSRDRGAKFMGEMYPDMGNQALKDAFVIRARLALEIGYAMIEMLYETDFENEKIVLTRSAHAAAVVFRDLPEVLTQ